MKRNKTADNSMDPLMHLFDGKKGILRPNNGLVFKLMP